MVVSQLACSACPWFDLANNKNKGSFFFLPWTGAKPLQREKDICSAVAPNLVIYVPKVQLGHMLQRKTGDF